MRRERSRLCRGTVNTRWRLSYNSASLFICQIFYFASPFSFISFLLQFFPRNYYHLIFVDVGSALPVSLPIPPLFRSPRLSSSLFVFFFFLSVLVPCTCAFCEERQWVTLWEIPSPSFALQSSGFTTQVPRIKSVSVTLVFHTTAAWRHIILSWDLIRNWLSLLLYFPLHHNKWTTSRNCHWHFECQLW